MWFHITDVTCTTTEKEGDRTHFNHQIVTEENENIISIGIMCSLNLHKRIFNEKKIQNVNSDKSFHTNTQIWLHINKVNVKFLLNPNLK